MDSCDEEDAWLFGQAVTAYSTLSMYDLPNPARKIMWTKRNLGEMVVLSSEQVQVVDPFGLFIFQVQVMELPEKIVLGDKSSEIFDERDLNIVSGTLLEHAPHV